ncbi:MAG: hypothetical protein JWM95_4014 [Gemmatimonadetes bacterium]|nr:hypothetical protein [Gemmatimonadota bacterium]
MTKGMHPHEYVRSLLLANRAIRQIELSTYINVPESLTDRRESFCVRAEDVERRFGALAKSLSAEEEIAFHSRVQVEGAPGRLRPRHFPLLDFKTADSGVAEDASERLVAEHEAPRAALFTSGHSYHLYMDLLLSDAQWTKFMGRVLLLNPREGPAIVDNRWVGHRLMSGFGALRWSANTPPYTQPPRLLRRWGTV